MGQWIEVEGGRVWRVEVAAGNAYTARLHLMGIDLRPGQEIRLSNPGQEDSVVGPIEGNGEFGDGTTDGADLGLLLSAWGPCQ